MIATSHQLYRELKRLIPNLPDRAKVIKIIIDLRANGEAYVHTSYFPDLSTKEPVTKRYQLVEIEGENG